MDECDLEAEHAAARRLVDQLGAGFREAREGGAKVVDLVCHVVHPGPALRKEATDRCVLAERAEQLEPAVSDANGRSLDSLFLHPSPLLEPGGEQPLVRIERAVEVIDCQTDVMHRARGLHVGDGI